MKKTLRALHVEDQERDVALLTRHLARVGYELIQERVETPAAMRAALEEKEWDVILCDFSMPHFNALAALTLLQEMKLDIPFIIISGTVGEDVAVEAMRAGASDYLMKDNLARLAPTIERELHEAENRHARRRAEEALRESEDRYRDLVEHSHDLICTHDLAGRILSVNQTAVKALGYDQVTLVEKNIRDILFTEYRGEFDNYIRELLEKGIAHGLMSAQTRTGEKRIWEYTNTLRTEGVAEPIVRGVAHDVTEQKRAEAALKASESQLRALFAAMTDVILVLDREGRYIEIMATNANLLYRPSSDLLGRTLHEVFPREEADFFLNHVRRALNEGRMHGVEYRIEIDGTEVWFDGSVSPITKDQVIWVARDITERKRAEQQIRLQATALESAANAIVLTDNQGIINWVNPAFTTLTGYTPEEVLGRNTSILKSGSHDPAFYQELWETIISGQVWHGELINRRKDGSLYFEEQTITPLMNEAGRITNFIAIKQDVTKQKHAEAELRRSEAQYRRLIDTTFEGVWMFDAEMKTTYVNRRLTEMLGVTAEEMIGRTPLDFVSEDSRADVQQRLQLRTQGIKEQYDVHLRRKDGSDLWAIACATPILDEHGAFTGSLSMLTDITERKQVEEERARLNLELESERQRLDNVVANVPGVVWEAWGVPDAATQRIDFVSDYVEQMLGYSVEEWLQTPNFWLTIVHPDDREQAGRIATEDFARGQSRGPQEFRWVAKDGRAIWVESNYVVVKDDEGQPVGLRGVTTDISERKQAEEKIRQSERQLAEAQSIAHIGSWDWDLQNNTLIWSDEHYRIFGLDPQEYDLSYESVVMEHVHPEDRDLVKRTIEHSIKTKESFDFNYRVIHSDGDVRVVHSLGNVVSDEQGNAIKLFGTVQDVTEIKRAEDELRKSEERYRDLVENAHDIIYSHDLAGNYTSINKAGEQITGYTRKEALKMNLMQTVAPEYLEKAREMIARKLADEKVTAYELEIIAKDGHRVALEVNTKLVIQDGVAVGVQGIARDVTERKQLEEQLRQAQKMEAIGQLAGGVAHDFNNLLTAITGYSDLALRRLKAEDPLRRNIEEIKKAGDRAAALTRQLLAFSRKQVLQPVVLELNSVVADVEKMLRRLIGEDIELRTVLDPHLGSIKADPGQIEQVLMNLVVNARDAMPMGGKLTIETKNVHLSEDYARQHIAAHAGPFVMLAVTDTGVGMNEETRKRIFEPFFTTKEQGKGTGLGLSTVYGIVKQSGGNIWVYSEIGHGTTFKIYLPRVDEDAKEYKRSAEIKEERRGTETILLVEDEGVVRSLAQQVLEMSGYRVLEAANGGEALLICERHREPIDLIVTDVIMPGMSGRELTDRLAQLHPEMRILYMSGYTDDAILHQGVLEVGMNFIEKPFSPGAFVRKVREVLDQDA